MQGALHVPGAGRLAGAGADLPLPCGTGGEARRPLPCTSIPLGAGIFLDQTRKVFETFRVLNILTVELELRFRAPRWIATGYRTNPRQNLRRSRSRTYYFHISFQRTTSVRGHHELPLSEHISGGGPMCPVKSVLDLKGPWSM